MNIFTRITKNNYIRIGAFIISILIVAIFSGLTDLVNSNTEKILSKFSTENVTDTNIVLVEITQSDIEQLGSWPIKRSYYALLFNYLEKLSPKKIGFGIFLSNNSSSQSIYNELLSKEISDNSNIVFGSLLNGLNLDDGIVTVDSIIYPVLKQENKNLTTGHLDYFYTNGIYIPLTVNKKKTIEYAFSEEIVNDFILTDKKLVKLNSFINYKDYKKFSLLQFLRLAAEKSNALQTIKNKFVLVGVTDPSLINEINLPNGKSTSGIMLHAIAVDNLINGQALNFSYYNLSGYIFIILILFLLLFSEKIKGVIFYPAIILVFLIGCSLLFNYYFLEFNYSLFIVPLIFIVLSEFPIYVTEKDKELSATISESEILKNLLLKKENKLSELESDLLKENTPSKELTSEIELLKNQIEEFHKSEELEKEVKFENISEGKNFNGIIYSSSKMAAIVNVIEKVAPQNATVLITGETGSGKELVAQAIHKLSKRKDNNFVAINCAAISESLLESELFGHKKGAFTNAIADKKGMFEAADKGTIFLDEIGETSESFQVKLLRVLQSGEMQKVGSVETNKVDVRVVAASNKNIEKLVAEKKFREDLYYRLKVIEIYIPPLRERKDDIELLIKHFLEKDGTCLLISKGVLTQLIENEWKGNVRELESIIVRASIFAKGENRNIIKLCDLPDELVKLNKADIGNLILESLRGKEFSHTAINETAKELGGLSRTSVSEHYRGMFLKEFVISNFNFEKAVESITKSNSENAKTKVFSKGKTYIHNIEKDLGKVVKKDFVNVKEQLKTKYKNLPSRYHLYLDKVIRHLLEHQ